MAASEYLSRKNYEMLNEDYFICSLREKYGVTSGPTTGKNGPEITPYLDTFHLVAVLILL